MQFWQDCIGCSGDCVGEAESVGVWLQTEQGGGSGSGDGMSAPYTLPPVEVGATDDRQPGDVLAVVGGGLWYSYGADCQASGCQMWLGYDTGTNQYVPNSGSPISGTTSIPFDEFYSFTGPSDGIRPWTTPSGDPGRPVGSTDAGIVGNCGSDAWSQLSAGTTVTFTLGGATGGADYSSLYDLLNNVFGTGDTIHLFNSWLAHFVFKNQRTGSEYHMMAWNNSCF